MPSRARPGATDAEGAFDPAPGAQRPNLPEPIRSVRVVAIGRGLEPASALRVAEAVAAGGIRAYEVTLQNDRALGTIESLAVRFGRDDTLAVGAGTILSVPAAEAAINAGASFLVMPHFDDAVVRWAAARGVPTLPGALTPTEILAAWRAGAAAVKLFPASAVGPAFVRELHGPLPEIPLVPTGGVTATSAPAYLAAGAAAVGIGGWLMGEGDPSAVRARAAQLVAAIATAGHG